MNNESVQGSHVPLSRIHGPARPVEALELAASASSDTPIAWRPCQAIGALQGGLPGGCCIAAPRGECVKRVGTGERMKT